MLAPLDEGEALYPDDDGSEFADFLDYVHAYMTDGAAVEMVGFGQFDVPASEESHGRPKTHGPALHLDEDPVKGLSDGPEMPAEVPC